MMQRRLRTAFALVAAALAFALPSPARAQAYDAANAGIVARISVVRGTVTLQHGEGGASAPATLNAPVMPGDYVSTGADARAEIEFDAASALRLGSAVQLRFTQLDRNARELQLAEGTIEVRLLRDDAAQTQVDTPSIAVRPSVAGSYRVSVDSAGRTQLTVRTGRAEVIAPQETRIALSGTTLYAEGPASNPTLRTGAAVALDEFDRFNAERDGPELRALTDPYAPPGVAGVADLQTYGHWLTDGSYGTVWVPYAVSSGWAPYRNGAWSWYAPYGWTWIGYEPWGWAPYHYGRWYHHPHYGWCWVPARAVVPWSPALVNFVTFGGPRLGTIGWVPLAPFEPFAPWWGASSYNAVTHVTYVGPNAPYGMTGISKERFLEGRFHERFAIARNGAHGAYVVSGVPVAPPHERRGDADASATGGNVWTRFATTRNAPVHAVQVIDGSRASGAALQRGTGVWSRFDRTEARPQLAAPTQRAQHVPAQYVPAQYVPAQYAPVQSAPARYAPAGYAPVHAAPAYSAPAAPSRPEHASAPHERSASSTTHHKP